MPKRNYSLPTVADTRASQAALNATKKMTLHTTERTRYENKFKNGLLKLKNLEQKLADADVEKERLKREAADAKEEDYVNRVAKEYKRTAMGMVNEVLTSMIPTAFRMGYVARAIAVATIMQMEPSQELMDRLV
ncbi:hypothetical protein RHSIM_Rhsim09G0073800 [Rhododendron simsii]|uniref:Uncharacterized protein n=1 Tax=Rhododendron simsii TaxID=118357 RepID=A0A834LFD0_RHOSS|nr:hypothetical protein RHSIM_Rhsim09G0073800 [Rhododendron simsii]